MNEEMFGQRVDELTRAMMDLPGVDPRASGEAGELARLAVAEGEGFAQHFHVVRPSWLNNCLVNTKVHDSGLCWQYMYHLFLMMEREQPQYFALRCAVRDKGRLFHEHHAVAISATDAPFSDSLIIDAWQDCGRVIWFAPTGERGEWSDDPYETRKLVRENDCRRRSADGR